MALSASPSETHFFVCGECGRHFARAFARFRIEDSYGGMRLSPGLAELPATPDCCLKDLALLGGIPWEILANYFSTWFTGRNGSKNHAAGALRYRWSETSLHPAATLRLPTDCRGRLCPCGRFPVALLVAPLEPQISTTSQTYFSLFIRSTVTAQNSGRVWLADWH